MIDPTANVLLLVDAAVKRLDDIGSIRSELQQERIRRIDDLRVTDTRRVDELRQAESRRVDEHATMRAEYENKLSEAEKKRIDAIRAVDVAAVAVASERATQQATVLANQVACVSEDTPILCADLVWRPAGALEVGDELIGFDEEPEERRPIDPVCSRGRRYRSSTVTANSLKRDELLLVTTPKGAVRCNREHPWLVKRIASKKPNWVWARADTLQPGDMVMHCIDVWETDRSYEAGWLAGILDGEGCLDFQKTEAASARLCVVQVDGPIADMIRDSMGARVSTNTHQRNVAVANRKPQTGFVVNVKADIMKLLGSVRPARFMVNAEKVWRDSYIGGAFRATTVTSVVLAGSGVIASLTTSTKTYIAAGFAMHNTSADALRTLVATTAAAMATQSQNTTGQFQERLALLERSQYETKGRSALADPQLAEMLAELRGLRTRASTETGKSAGVSMAGALVMGAITLVSLLLGVGVTVFEILGKR